MQDVGGHRHPKPPEGAVGAWRFTVGHKGVSRITVFERPDATSLFVEWWDDFGRHRQALSDALGHPVTEKKVAEKIARRMALAQERKRNQQAVELLGLPTGRTLKELLDRRHADLKRKWTPKYAKSRDALHKFWLARLGDVRLTAVTAAVVERIALEAQAEGKKPKSVRWRQDVLRYLVDSFIYAEKKLKWIEARHNLSAVDVPVAKGKSVAYTEEEGRSLVRMLWTVHPVAGWLGTVAFQTGRRIGAIRTLDASAVTTDADWTLIAFPGETDKARNTGVAAVHELPARSDWSVPSYEACVDWLEAAEKRAGISHLPGRGWHGLKRLYATLTVNQPGADRQSGTRKETLEAHYRQDVLNPKKDIARLLAEKLARA